MTAGVSMVGQWRLWAKHWPGQQPGQQLEQPAGQYGQHNQSRQTRQTRPLVRFGAVSLFSSLTDLSIFMILTRFVFSGELTGIFAATVTARILSGLCNFLLNRIWVFEAGSGLRRQAFWYLVLFGCQLAGSAVLVWQLSGLPLPLTLVKMIVDGSMFLLSYQIQRRLIFKKQRKGDLI